MTNRLLSFGDIQRLFREALKSESIPLGMVPFAIDGTAPHRITHEPSGEYIEFHTALLMLPDSVFKEDLLVPFLRKARSKIMGRPAPDATDVGPGKRGSIYGPFLHNGIVSQAIKDTMRNAPDPDNLGQPWDRLSPDAKEGLEQIATKISRIITGDPDYLDNWDDIAGYAKIVADRIRARAPKGEKHA